jgi:hypothetical protein
MSKSFWPAGKASIILLPSGEQGLGLFELAKSWAEAGLLGPAFWIFPEKIQILENQPPHVEAIVLGVNSDRTVLEISVELFEQLARENLQVVRLVKLRAATLARESDELQDQIVSVIESYLGWSMPAADSRASDRDPVLDYQPVNLICIPTEFKASSKENFSRIRNGTTVIAAPEDRTTPWSGDAFVRDDERFQGFTLMHLATVSGIWHGLPVGTLELFERERSAMQQVWISRVFYSGVFTDGLARRVSASFVEEAASPDVEAFTSPSGTVFIDELYEQDYVDVMVQGTFLLDGGALEYQRPEMPGDPTKGKIGIAKQVGEYFVFLGRKLGKLPHWAWLGVKRIFAKEVQKKFQGEEGALEVGIGLEEQVDIYDLAIIQNWEQVLREQKTAQETLSSPIKLAQVKSSHSLWQGLRELVFGSLDGGFDLSWVGFQPLDDDRRPIFKSPASVFPLEYSRWEAVNPLPNEISNKLSELSDKSLLTELDRWIETTKSKLEESGSDLGMLSSKYKSRLSNLEELKSFLHENKATRVDENGEEQVLSLEEAVKTSQSEIQTEESEELVESTTDELVEKIRQFKEIESELKNLERELAASETSHSELIESLDKQNENALALRKFLENSNRTFMAKTIAAMDSRLESVRSDLSKFEDALNSLVPPGLGRLVALRKKFHRSLFWALFASAAFVGVLIGVYHLIDPSDRASWIEPWESVIVGITLLLLATVSIGIAYYRGWSQLQRAVTLQRADVDRVVRGYRVVRSEENRLRILYAQARNWLDLLRVAVLNPWSVRDSWKQSSLRSLDLNKLPFAMRVAQAQDDQEAPLYVLKSAAAKQLLVRGWRARAFEMLIAEIAKAAGKGSSFKVESLDRDLPHASNGARKLVEEFIDQKAILERVAARHIKPLIDKLQGEAMSTARPKVLEADFDPLSPIRTDPESIVQYEPEQDWDEFLGKSISLRDGTRSPNTPLSALSMGDAHIQSGEHEKVVGHILMPKRIMNELETKEAGNVVFFPYQESSPSPVDSVIRVDVVGPMELGVTRIMSGADLEGSEMIEDIKIRGKLFD